MRSIREFSGPSPTRDRAIENWLRYEALATCEATLDPALHLRLRSLCVLKSGLEP